MYKQIKQNFEFSLKHLSYTVHHKQELDNLKNYILEKHSKNEIVKLMFICTHNSRRSHIGQILAFACSVFFEVDRMEFYSGGTEETAFHSNAIKALERFGFQIRKLDETTNPKYEVSVGEKLPSLIAFSKKYTHPSNPQEGFAAIMVCDDANENCPVVYGSERRFKLTYEDPKIFDHTSEVEDKYYEKVLEILGDMIYLFSELKKQK